jgi:hypothetical protein
VAKRLATSSWSAASTCTRQREARRNASKLAALRARLHSANGGSSETEANELAVMPTGSSSVDRVVTTVTPVANCASARRSSWLPLGFALG